jgi:hypothetical protein
MAGRFLCRPSPIPRQADGSASSADAEGGIRTRTIDLSSCEAKGQLLLDAWPR